MTFKLYGNAGFSFVSWKPAKDQLREMLERMGVRVNHVRDLPLSFGGTRLEAYIEHTPDMNMSDLVASLEAHRAGVNISVTIYTGPPPDEQPLPIPAPPWWSTLQLTQPKTKIYTARALVKIYRSMGLSHPPQVSDVARVASNASTGYDVWAAPLAGSEWICVFNGDAADPPQPGFVLWANGNDMRATP